jgi:MFS family permease
MRANRNLLALWVAQAVSLLGDRINYLALVALIGSAAGGLAGRSSSLRFSLLAACTTAPVMVFAGLAGVLVDRWPKKSVLMICDALRAVLVLLLPLTQVAGWGLPGALFLVVVLSCVNVFFLPARAAILPELVPRDSLVAANAAITAGAVAATVVGSAVGGALVEARGYAWGFYVDAISYAFSVGALALIQGGMQTRGGQKTATSRDVADGSNPVCARMFAGLVTGLRALRVTQVASLATALFVLLYAVGASLFVLAPPMVAKISDHSTRDVGFLLALLAGGVILGAGAVTWLRRRGVWILAMVGGGVLGVALAGFGLAPRFAVLGVLAVLSGIGAAPLLVGSDAVLQAEVAPEHRARAFAARDVLSKTTFLFSALLVGAVARWVQASVLLVAEGMLVGCGTLALTLRMRASRARVMSVETDASEAAG